MRVPFSDPQAYRTDRFHSAMLTAVEFFELFLLLLACVSYKVYRGITCSMSWCSCVN